MRDSQVMQTVKREAGYRSIRYKLSHLLGRSLEIAAGACAYGGTLETNTILPRIKLKQQPAGGGCLSFPLTSGEAKRIKVALSSAGQEPDANAEGVIETRLPWAARPDLDFRIVNKAPWKSVVTKIVRKVPLPGILFSSPWL